MNYQTNPNPKTINPTPGSPLHGNIRRSKIGRLPTEIRHWLNLRLRDCVPYETISEQLTKMGYPGITVSNISTWSTGGHLHWLRDQDAADQLRDQANRLTDVLAEMEGDTVDKCAKLAEQMAAIQIAQMLQNVDPITGKCLLQENQELFFRLVRALTHQKREQTFSKKAELEQRKYNDQVENTRREQEKAEQEQQEQNDCFSDPTAPTAEEMAMAHDALGVFEPAGSQMPEILKRYRQLIFRVKREAAERARLNNWENAEEQPWDPVVAAVERGEDPFSPRQIEQPQPTPSAQQNANAAQTPESPATTETPSLASPTIDLRESERSDGVPTSTSAAT